MLYREANCLMEYGRRRGRDAAPGRSKERLDRFTSRAASKLAIDVNV
jgi:hypothetical protein